MHHEQHDVTVDDDGTTTFVRMHGEIDPAVREEAGRAMGQALIAGLPVVVDLSKVTFIDSSGMAFLVQLHRACHSAELSCVLHAVPDNVREVLTLVGLDQVLGLRDEVAP